MKFLVLLLAAALGLAGCSTARPQISRAAELPTLQRLFVEHRLNDNHRLHQLIVSELQRLGYEASSGPLTMMPETADAYLTYEDRWTGDFRTHMVGFEVAVHHPRSRKVLATGALHRASLGKKTPEEMIRAVLEPLFQR